MPLTKDQQKWWNRRTWWYTWHLSREEREKYRDEGGYPFHIGRQYYKSGWMVKAPEKKFGKSQKRWFQLRHGYFFYYEKEQDWYNYPHTDPAWKKPDDEKDDEEKGLLDFDFDLKLPKLPELPKLSMPDMPDISMPDVSMPDVSMPDVSMPDMSMPDMSAPSFDLKSLAKKLPKQKKKPSYGPYGLILVYHNGCTVKRDGADIILEKATQYKFFDKNEREEKKNRKFVLTAENKDEAKAWYISLCYAGCKPAEGAEEPDYCWSHELKPTKVD
jgi:hypothetical protein